MRMAANSRKFRPVVLDVTSHHYEQTKTVLGVGLNAQQDGVTQLKLNSIQTITDAGV